MKNLKKVLALVLALATVMGLGVTASAKEYTDSNTIAYTEAVDVMSALKILDGNPDGSFAPTKTLTREQAAKMVSYLLNGGKDVNDLYSGSNTFTDCYNSWAKGYIAYVNQMGIVSGVGNGKFNPKGTLTGVQLAKMMLTSLGYDAKIEGYQGSNTWMVNIINDAQNAGLLKGMDTVNLYNAITREQASQMMFNALKADMVGYESKGSEITLPGIGTIIQGASTPKAEKQGSYANNMGEGKANDASTQTLQLAEKYFGGTKGLKTTNVAADAFGRPAHEWMYNAKTVGSYSDEANLTYTTQVEAGKIYVDLGKVKDSNAVVYTDGKSAGNTGSADIDANKTGKIGGQGALTEVYVGDFDNNANTADTVRIVVTNTYTGTISKFTKATDSTDAYITVAKESANNIASFDSKFVTDKFTAADEDARVLYTVADGKIKSVEIAKTIEGTMSKYSSSAITVDGTSYKLAAKNILVDTNVFDGTYTYYLDTYGNVIFNEVKQAGSQNYAYVEKVDENDSLFGGSGVKAQIVLADGTRTVVDVAVKSDKSYAAPLSNGTIGTGTANGTNADNDTAEKKEPKTWFSYTVNSNKEYTFKAVTPAYATVIDMTGTGAGKELVKDKATTFTVDSPTSRNAYTTAKTVVTSVDKDYKVSTATGLIGADLEGKVLVTYSKGGNTISAIYAVGQTITLSNAEITYAYALKKDSDVKDGDLWQFAINGKVETYVVDDGSNIPSGNIYNLGVTDGKVTTGLNAEVNNTKTGTVAYADATTVVITGGTGAGTYTVGENFKIYNVDADLSSSEMGKVDTLDKNDVVKFVTDGVANGKILVAYITTEA